MTKVELRSAEHVCVLWDRLQLRTWEGRKGGESPTLEWLFFNTINFLLLNNCQQPPSNFLLDLSLLLQAVCVILDQQTHSVPFPFSQHPNFQSKKERPGHSPLTSDANNSTGALDNRAGRFSRRATHWERAIKTKRETRDCQWKLYRQTFQFSFH